MTQSQVPGKVADYFGADVVREHHPTIAQMFVPGKGWVTYPGTKRVSISWLRKLQGEGVTLVALHIPGRTADFSIREILAHANRPLLGGRVI